MFTLTKSILRFEGGARRRRHACIQPCNIGESSRCHFEHPVTSKCQSYIHHLSMMRYPVRCASEGRMCDIPTIANEPGEMSCFQFRWKSVWRFKYKVKSDINNGRTSSQFYFISYIFNVILNRIKSRETKNPIFEFGTVFFLFHSYFHLFDFEFGR